MGDLIAAFRAAARAGLTGAGWRKSAGDVYFLDLGGGFQAWVGLNKASRHHPLKINPVVGLRYDPLERLVTDLLGQPPGRAVTIARPVAYLTPGNTFLQLTVAAERDAGPAADELCGLVDAYGLPFARRHADPDALTGALEAGGNVPNPDRVRLLLPAMHVLQGRIEDARASLDLGLAHFQDTIAGPAAAEFRLFAAALAPLLADQDPEVR
ncbi:hypothetical protein [Streptomyces sp. NPDC001389]|uniref:hypothetical protein n=1 Tax=Streptomyces sp. NPDC001389 TaxID=3364569 RepID=UPI0036AA9321